MTYFNCISNFPCFDSSTRSIIQASFTSYQSIINLYCNNGQVIFPRWRTVIRVSIVGFSRFTQAQYINNCETIFTRFGYSNGATLCQNWANYISYIVNGTRVRRSSSDIQVVVTAPDGEVVPPNTDESNLQVQFTDESDQAQTENVAVASVSTSNVEATTTMAPPANSNNPGSASYVASSIAVTVAAVAAAVVLAF